MSEISPADREAMGDEAVSILDPMEWDVFLCAYGLGDKPPMKVSEIVVELGLSDSTVRRALKRARVKYAAVGEAISPNEGDRRRQLVGLASTPSMEEEHRDVSE